MKKQRKKIALNTFKIAKLTTDYSFIIGGSRSGHNTVDVTVNGSRGSSECQQQTQTINPTTVGTQNSSIPCADEFKTYQC